MRLKTGDKVIVITGSNKGKEGIIKKVLRDSDKVIVEGIINADILYKTSDDERYLSAIKTEIPFSSMIDIAGAKEVL